MENHGQGQLLVGAIVIELRATVISAGKLIEVLVKMVKKPDEISRSAGGEPIITYLLFVERIQQAERIVDPDQSATEMIAVIALAEHAAHLLDCHTLQCRHLGDRLRKITFQLIFRDAAQRVIQRCHAYVIGLIKTAEHAYLGELGDSGQEDELEVGIGFLED